jgi:hypothetical protein
VPSVVIPEWLQTRPSDFLKADEEGVQAGLQQRGQDLEHSARMAAIAQQGADAQLSAQEQSERTAVAREVAKNRMQLQTANAANIFQQQQQRQRAIDGGMSPIDAWLQFPGTSSGSPGGGAFAAYNREHRASLPLQMVPDPNDPTKTLGVYDGANFHPIPRSAAKAPAISPTDKIAIDALSKQYQTTMAQIAKTPNADPRITTLRKQALQAQQALQKFGVDFTGPSKPAAAPGAAAGGPLAPPTKGQVINGHTFQGGDPADPESWEEVNPQGSSFMGEPGGENEAELPGGASDEPDED